MSMRASASTSAAPPMSFFMRIMPLPGLDVEAAGVEAHALAHQRDERIAALAPAHVDETRLARTALAHFIDEWIVLPQQVFADDDPALGFVLQRETLHGLAELLRPQVVRRRIDEIARFAQRFAGEPHVFEIGARRAPRARASRAAVLR